MTQKFSMSPEEMAKLYAIRRSSRKLASKKSRQRVVRKLQPIMVVVPEIKPNLEDRFCEFLNRHKRLTYIILLGAVLNAYVYDAEPRLLESKFHLVRETVESACQFYLHV